MSKEEVATKSYPLWAIITCFRMNFIFITSVRLNNTIVSYTIRNSVFKSDQYFYVEIKLISMFQFLSDSSKCYTETATGI